MSNLLVWVSRTIIKLWNWSLLSVIHFRIRHRKSQPSIAVRPITSDPYSTLIEFTPVYYHGTWRPLKDSLKNFLGLYGHGKYPGGSNKCKWHTDTANRDKTNWCHVSRRKLIDWSAEVKCSKGESYGFPMSQPCIYLRPTKLFDWEPKPFYNLTEVELHPTMPKIIKDKIGECVFNQCHLYFLLSSARYL